MPLADEGGEIFGAVTVSRGDAGQDDGVGAAEGGERLAQDAAREDAAVAGQGRGVEEHQVEVAPHRQMLETVVEDQHGGMQPVDGQAAGVDTAPADDHRHSWQGLGEHRRFIATLLRREEQGTAVGDDRRLLLDRSPVAAADDGRAKAHGKEEFRQVAYHRRLAAAAQHQVAYRKYRYRQAVAGEDICRVERCAQTHGEVVERPQRAAEEKEVTKAGHVSETLREFGDSGFCGDFAK